MQASHIKSGSVLRYFMSREVTTGETGTQKLDYLFNYIFIII